MTDKNAWIRLKEKFIEWGWGALLIVPFIIIGLFTFSYSCYNIYKADATESWLQRPAKVIHTELQTHKDSKGKTTTEVVIKYAYVVDEKEYTNTKIAFGYSKSNLNDDNVLFERLNNAQKIIVYVNPKDSRESVIVPGLNNSIIFVALFAIFWNTIIICAFLSICFEKHKYIFGAFTWVVIITVVAVLFSGILNIEFNDGIKILEFKHEVSN